MTLHEFITYCTLRGLIKHEMKIPEDESAYDSEADGHYKVAIETEGYRADIIYAVVLEQAVLIRGILYEGSASLGNTKTCTQPEVSDLVRAFCS